MLVEFVGLPGCGKTTLASDLEKRLGAEGFRAQGLRNAAKALMTGAQDKIGFLRHRAERTSLYGACLFADTNPDLFDWVVRTSRVEFTGLLWNLEALSQLGIVTRHGPADLVVLNDEGFIQRFAGNFLDTPEAAELDTVIDLLPDAFLTVSVNVPPEMGHARAKARRKGIPLALRDRNDDAVLTHFQRYDRVLRRAVAARVARGCPVLELDGTVDSEALADQVMDWLRPLLPAATPPSLSLATDAGATDLGATAPGLPPPPANAPRAEKARKARK